jgi:hypothetical protein
MTAITVAWFALYAAVLGWLRGTGEGQVFVKPVNVMHRPIEWVFHESTTDGFCERVAEKLRQFDLGPRGHRWHRYYHAIDGIKDAMFVGLGVWLAWVYRTAGVVDTLSMTALAGAIIYLCCEPAHSYARYRRFDNNGEPEHVTFADLRLVVPWYGAHDVGNGVIQHDGWYWRQILPFHAPVWAMTLIRLALAAGLLAINL